MKACLICRTRLSFSRTRTSFFPNDKIMPPWPVRARFGAGKPARPPLDVPSPFLGEMRRSRWFGRGLADAPVQTTRDRTRERTRERLGPPAGAYGGVDR